MTDTLTFHHVRAVGSGLYQSNNCSVPDCNRAGRNFARIMGHPAGVYCNAHKKEWLATWKECSPVSQAANEKVAA
jgi:hypothetical protein